MKTYTVVITNKLGVKDRIVFGEKKYAKKFIKDIRNAFWVRSVKLVK